MMDAKSPSMSALRTSGPPALVLGTMNFGKRTNERDSIEIIRRALGEGVTAFDTANIYCEGESERILGKGLGADRARVSVATKVGAWKGEGLKPERVKTALSESLTRLGMDHVDIYYLHVPDHATPLKETLAGMKDLIASGAARAWGVSNYASWQILDMCAIADEIGLARPVIAQQLYNLVHRELDIEHFAWKRAHPIHLTVYNALAGGLLTDRHTDKRAEKGSRLDTNPLYRRRYVTDVMFERAADLRELAKKHGLSLVELAYAFLGTRKEIDSVLVGPANLSQLEAAMKGVARELPPACVTELEQVYRTWMGTDTHYVR